MPLGAQFPLGFFSYKVVGLYPGEVATVTFLPHSHLRLTSYYKYGREPDDNPATANLREDEVPHWYEFLYDGTTGAEVYFESNGYEFRLDETTPPALFNDPSVFITRIVLHFVDGRRGDDDLEADGVITDPGGPATDDLAAGGDGRAGQRRFCPAVDGQ